MTFPRWLEFKGESTRDMGMLRCREVATDLFVGGLGSALVVPSCSAIVSLEFLDEKDRKSLVGTFPDSKLVYCPFGDGDPIPREGLDRTIQAWDERTGPVLIHCAQGLSRSASVAYALLRLRFGLDHDESMRRIFVYERYPMRKTLASAVLYVQGSGSRPSQETS